MLATAKRWSPPTQEHAGPYWVAIFTSIHQRPNKLDAGQKSAQGLLANVEKVFAEAKNPPRRRGPAWKKERANIRILRTRRSAGCLYAQENDAATKGVQESAGAESGQCAGFLLAWLDDAAQRPRRKRWGSSHRPRNPSRGPGSAASDHQEPLQALPPEGITRNTTAIRADGRAESQRPRNPRWFRPTSKSSGPMNGGRKEEEFRKTNRPWPWDEHQEGLTGPNSHAYFASSMRRATCPAARWA